MKPSEFKISISVESYDKKSSENYRNYFFAESASFPNCQRYRSQILIAQIGNLKISHPYLWYFPINKLSKSVTVGLGRAGSGCLRALPIRFHGMILKFSWELFSSILKFIFAIQFCAKMFICVMFNFVKKRFRNYSEIAASVRVLNLIVWIPEENRT